MAAQNDRHNRHGTPVESWGVRVCRGLRSKGCQSPPIGVPPWCAASHAIIIRLNPTYIWPRCTRWPWLWWTRTDALDVSLVLLKSFRISSSWPSSFKNNIWGFTGTHRMRASHHTSVCRHDALQAMPSHIKSQVWRHQRNSNVSLFYWQVLVRPRFWWIFKFDLEFVKAYRYVQCLPHIKGVPVWKRKLWFKETKEKSQNKQNLSAAVFF